MLKATQSNGRNISIQGDRDDIESLCETLLWLVRYAPERPVQVYLHQRALEITEQRSTAAYVEIETPWPHFLIQTVIVRQSCRYLRARKQDWANLFRLEVCAEETLLDYDRDLGGQCVDWLNEPTFRLQPVKADDYDSYLLAFVRFRTAHWVATYKPGKDSFRRLPALLRSFQTTSARYDEFAAELITMGLEPGEALSQFDDDTFLSMMGYAKTTTKRPKYSFVAYCAQIPDGFYHVNDAAPGEEEAIARHEFQAVSFLGATRAASTWYNRTFGRHLYGENEHLMGWWSHPGYHSRPTRTGQLLVVKARKPDENKQLEEFPTLVKQGRYQRSQEFLKMLSKFVRYRMKQAATRVQYEIHPDDRLRREINLYLYDFHPQALETIAREMGVSLAELDELLGERVTVECHGCGNRLKDVWLERGPEGFVTRCPGCGTWLKFAPEKVYVMYQKR